LFYKGYRLSSYRSDERAIGKWGISKCWDIYKGKIRFFSVDLSEIHRDLFEPKASAEKILVGIEE
jgi:hypothetical protein